MPVPLLNDILAPKTPEDLERFLPNDFNLLDFAIAYDDLQDPAGNIKIVPLVNRVHPGYIKRLYGKFSRLPPS